MKLYLAGPMTGYTNFNFPHFAEITVALRANGHKVTSPAEVEPDTTLPWEACMKKDIAALLECDGIAMLKGWEKSRGASLERHIAVALGMAVHCAYELAAKTEVSE